MKLTEMSWVKDFRDFANDTSAHGVKYIFEGPYKLIKLLFLVTWLGFSIYACHVIISSIIMFIDRPTSTKYEVVVDDGSVVQSIKFPTISVCSKNKVRRSYLEQEGNEAINEYFRLTDQYDMEAINDRLSAMDDEDGEWYSIRDMTYEDLIAAGGPKNNRFLKCQQRNDHCSNLPAFEGRNTNISEVTLTGTCWRINPDGKLKGKMGDYGALKLIFWADMQDYSERSADSESQGFIVAFHDNTSFGSTISSGFLMSPGTYYKADLRLKEEYRQVEKDNSCDNRVNSTYGAYSEGSCIMECKDRALYEACGCVNIRPPINTENYKSCTLKEWLTCGQKTYLEWHKNFTNTDKVEPQCSCNKACKEIRYEAQISSSSISPAYAEALNNGYAGQIVAYDGDYSNSKYNIHYNSSQDMLDNLMVLEVLFTSMQRSEVREIIKYDIKNLLGDIGGVLGLFLGASLFTILEFIQFVFFSVAKYCCNLGGKGKHSPIDSKEPI